MRREGVSTGLAVTLTVIIVALIVTLTVNWRATRTTSDPSGIWAGLVDDLPSGRLVECVFARDPSGSVAVTCDWQNAVVRGRP